MVKEGRDEKNSVGKGRLAKGRKRSREVEKEEEMDNLLATLPEELTKRLHPRSIACRDQNAQTD